LVPADALAAASGSTARRASFARSPRSHRRVGVTTLGPVHPCTRRARERCPPPPSEPCVTPVPAENPDELPPPTLVEDQAALDALLRDLDAAPEAAVDTEADSFFSYRERVCLIQVTVAERDFVVDPLAGLDLDGFGRFLGDPRKTKVFHDGEYDVLILKRDYGFTFENLFDTRVAASALGSATPGLASVLEEHFGVQLDKAMQRSDWSKRPLSEAQIRYARLDTHFLLPLMRRQQEAIRAAEREAVVAGECRRLEALEPPDRGFDPDGYAKLKGARNLRPQERRALRELFAWRDLEARRRDVPPFKVLPNTQMVALARALPTGDGQLARVEGMSPKLVRRVGTQLLSVVRKARELDPIPRHPRLPAKDGTDVLDDEGAELHERLKTWRKRAADSERMDSSLVLNRHGLLALARTRPRDPADLAGVEGVLDWQRERYGDDLLRVVRRFEDDLAAGKVDLTRRPRARR